MPQFVGYRVCQSDTIVLIHATRSFWATHATHISNTQCWTAFGGTDILPRYENSNIMMMGILIGAGIQSALPTAKWKICINDEPDMRTNFHPFSSLPTEILQSRAGNVCYVQIGMCLVLFQEDYLHNNHMNRIANGGVLIQQRHHIHDGQKILFHVTILMEWYHRRISHHQCFNMSGWADWSLDTLLLIPHSGGTIHGSIVIVVHSSHSTTTLYYHL